MSVMGSHALSTEARQELKDRIKDVVVRNDGMLLRCDMQNRFPKASTLMLAEVARELLTDSRLPNWHGWPRSYYPAVLEMKKHTRPRDVVIEEIKRTRWRRYQLEKSKKVDLDFMGHIK